MTEEQKKIKEQAALAIEAEIGSSGKKVVDAAFNYGMEISMAAPVDFREVLKAAVEFWKDKIAKGLASVEQLPELKPYLED